MEIKDLARRYRVEDGDGFRLKDFDPGDTGKLKKDRGHELLQQSIEQMRDMQSKLYAQDNWAILLILQAMDAAGKDGAIKHAFSGLNPQGCEVHPFKEPSKEELDHDFLWRCATRLPARGHIGIFNRSYYEEVLAVRVHRDLLAKEKLPPRLITKDIWKERFQDLCAFERYLSRNGVVVRKIYLNLSPEEQKRRLLARIEQPEKNWKFAMGDTEQRRHWPQFMDAYQDMIRHTATSNAPWYVVPADHKWFTRLVVAAVIIDTMESLKLKFPRLDSGQRKLLATARAELRRARQ